MFSKFLFFSLILTLLVSCNTGDDSAEIDLLDEQNESDSLAVDETEIDSASIEKDTVIEIVSDDPDVQQAHEEIVKEYGEQWDFCSCIVKNDSVNKAFENENLSEDDFDALFERSEYIDSKCKTILLTKNLTPKEREEHRKKINKCLRNHK